MRAEVEAVIASDGWTKLALQKMRKVDSFLRECQRVHGIASSKSLSVRVYCISSDDLVSCDVTTSDEGLPVFGWYIHPQGYLPFAPCPVNPHGQRILRGTQRIQPLEIFRHPGRRGRKVEAPDGQHK